MMYNREEHLKRVEWFQHDRFGMFIHWGLYAIPARGEWIRSVERISKEDYQPFFDEFDPVDYDPKTWAALAKKAGMKYAVMTAKHHDGFCLFDSKFTDYKSTNTKCKRDLVREYLDAFRAEGIKAGLYFSIIDWYHDDYPHYGDRQHPERDNEKFKDVKHNFDNYLDYMHNQVRELCENYGKLDILWFDFSYGELSGEAWRATELVRMVRSLQPHIIIDNRLEVSGEGFGSLLSDAPCEYSGDFVSPEQIIPPGGIVDNQGRPAVWEACITLNNNWGYCENDRFYKPAPMVIKKLVECVSKGGNMLLNVGPDAKGNIPVESICILSDVGDWMEKNGNSIYGCGISDICKPDYGRITKNGHKIYYHIMDAPVGFVLLEGIEADQIKKIRLLSSGSEIKISDGWACSNYPGVFISLGPDPVLPDTTDTVIEVELRANVKINVKSLKGLNK